MTSTPSLCVNQGNFPYHPDSPPENSPNSRPTKYQRVFSNWGCIRLHMMFCVSITGEVAMRHLSALLAAAAFAAPAFAQPCTPRWDRTIGNPGATDGYVGAFGLYQGDLYASGSFTNMAGVANTQYLARYNRTANTWSPVGGGLRNGISNAFGTYFANMGSDLYIGGFFSNADGLPDTKSIVRWDGSAYHSLGTGWGPDTVNAVWSLHTTSAIAGSPRLYIGGGFDTVAGQPAGCLAVWDGTTIAPVPGASTMTLVGINPLVDAITTFDDGRGGGTQLYIAGRFATVGGLSAKMIARWNGTTWSTVGTNLSNTIATGEIETMLVYDDGTGPALYVGGINIRLNGALQSISKWNGVTWTAVGQTLGGRVWSMVPFDDGSGTKLYACGTQAASGFIYRLEGNTWTTVDGGANAQAVRMMVDNNQLYVAGSFVTVGGQTSNHMVVRTSCLVTCGCAADYNSDGGVDGADVGAFFSDWEAAAGCADVNQDGGIDGADVGAFFAKWEAGGC